MFQYTAHNYDRFTCLKVCNTNNYTLHPTIRGMDQFCDKHELKMFALIEKGQLGEKGIVPTHGE